MMKKLVLSIAVFSVACGLAAATDRPAKGFEATYTATLNDVPAGLKEITVWIPLPVSRGVQTVSDVVIDSPYEWRKAKDQEFGNEYAVTTTANPPAGALAFKVHFKALRHEERIDHPAETKATKAELARALRADRMVTLSPRVRKLANEVTAGKSGPVEQAHAIYEHLLATMKYDKTVPGWGKGDTERACDIRAGNCTDFHSLFMSLARAKGIPTRFIIGFPLTAKDGMVAGYHCWAEFWVEGKGWIPVDASDASKLTNPEAREYLFGHLDPDRVQFTMGRDLNLTPRTAEPLNYFIYPHAEADGKEVGKPAVQLEFRAAQQMAGGVTAGE
ncbi:MAG TPA: transglutaminase domain-containing protein [Thermoanaerobaculia bacterium]|nr:transglutaminase domain-containing protein [Thermoanaerobaculia bacterium]